jgi:hypothetical protein
MLGALNHGIDGQRSGQADKDITPARAGHELEELVASLNHKFKGKGHLPWQGRSGSR